MSEVLSTGGVSSVSSFQTFKATPGLVVADAFCSRKSLGESEAHIKAATEWLKRAQDITPDDGFSYGYCLRGPKLKRIAEVGWRPSYVETTGYIIETFYDCSERFSDLDFAGRANRAARWLMSEQNVDGFLFKRTIWRRKRHCV